MNGLKTPAEHQPPGDLPPRDASRAEHFGLVSLALLVALALAGQAMLLCGLHLSALPLAVAVLAALICARLLTLRYLATTLVVCAALVLMGLFCAWYFDLSWDGQVYHQEAVLRLAGGWNPLWDPPLDETLRPNDRWVNHYPRAAWIAEAVLFRATGRIEAAKLIHLAWMATALCLSYAALRGFNFGARASLALSALASLNPVALCQALSFYVDGLVASTLTVSAALIALWWRRPRPGLLFALAAALVVLCNLKFTGAVYAALLIAGLGAATLALRREKWKSVALAGSSALVVGMLVVGYSPYAANAIEHGHPFYPVAGPQRAADVLAVTVTPSLRGKNRVEILARTLFSRSVYSLDPPEWKLPFAVRRQEVMAFAATDVRLGGFGPLFSGALLLALIGLAIGVARRAPGALPVLLICSGILASVLINEGLAVARYVPQLWLIPVLALMVARPRPVALAAGGVLFLNLVLVGGAYLAAQTIRSRREHVQLAAIERARGNLPIEVRFKDFDTNRERLREAGISYQQPAQLSCDRPGLLQFSETQICLLTEGATGPGSGRSPPQVPGDGESGAPAAAIR